jgi:tRNA(fMet)-specific endonuclease VapC
VILLDTNACIAIINGAPASVPKRLRRADPRRTQSRVSAISVFELPFGVARSARLAANTQALDVFLRSLAVLEFDEEDARIAGGVRAELERLGQPIGPYDYFIAAQALRHGLTLVTANEGEFSRVQGPSVGKLGALRQRKYSAFYFKQRSGNASVPRGSYRLRRDR